jgi:hypothetical protein
LNPVIITVLVTLGTITAFAFGLGYFYGRTNELDRVVAYLKRERDTAAGWVWGVLLERGHHRRKQHSEISD